MIKKLLNALHAIVRWFFHVMLIPVLAILKGFDALIQHLIIELEGV